MDEKELNSWASRLGAMVLSSQAHSVSVFYVHIKLPGGGLIMMPIKTFRSSRTGLNLALAVANRHLKEAQKSSTANRFYFGDGTAHPI